MTLFWQKVRWTLGIRQAKKLPPQVYSEIKKRFPANQTVTFLRFTVQDRKVSSRVDLEEVRKRLRELRNALKGDFCLYRAPPGKPKPLTAKHLLPNKVVNGPPGQLPMLDLGHIHGHLLGAYLMTYGNGSSGIDHSIAEQVVIKGKKIWILFGGKMDIERLKSINGVISRLSFSLLRTDREFLAARQAADKYCAEIEKERPSRAP